jgi:hypothetical protein
MLDGTHTSIFRSTHCRRSIPEWKYHCDAGEYTASSLPKLLYVIVSHRFSHLIKGEGFRD